GGAPPLSARLRLLWVAAVRCVNRAVLWLVTRLLFRPLPHDLSRVRRILVYRTGNVGDILVNVPTLDALRRGFPHAELVLLTSPGQPGAPGARELFAGAAWVDEMIVYHLADVAGWRGRRELVRRLRARGFDLCVSLPDPHSTLPRELRAVALARGAGCRHAVGFSATHVLRFAREQALWQPAPREAERIYALVADELRLPPPGPGLLPVPDADRAAAERLLEGEGLGGARFVVMHPGAKRSNNRWFADRFAAVADALAERHGLRVVLTGSAGEREIVEGVAAHMRAEPVVLCGNTSLLELAAVLDRAELYVGNDTGPMHLAAAVGTPVVAVFSARDFPGGWVPYGEGHAALRRDVPCSPCFKEECDVGLLCLDAISVDDVLREAEARLPSRLPPAGAREREMEPGAASASPR
ncbi:MAG TPA: glycosyltransferase family 9 protein, partial [Longimicrobiaceae bacterium]